MYFLQLKPWKWPWIMKVKKAVTYLRDYGKQTMKNRQDAVARGDHVPDDILTYILKLRGKERTNRHCCRYLTIIRCGAIIFDVYILFVMDAGCSGDSCPLPSIILSSKICNGENPIIKNMGSYYVH